MRRFYEHAATTVRRRGTEENEVLKGRYEIFRSALLNIQIFQDITLTHAEYLQTVGAGNEEVHAGAMAASWDFDVIYCFYLNQRIILGVPGGMCQTSGGCSLC